MGDEQTKALATREREEFGAVERAGTGATAVERALAAKETAAVQARYVMALQRPRDWTTVRERLLRECARPGFAEVARYSKPVGGRKIEGMSIRFAEAAIRCAGNLVAETVVIIDDEERRVLRVSLSDLESNAFYSQDVSVLKVVERRTLKEGQTPISKRVNSQGEVTFLVAATEDDLANKQGAACSKALRTLAFRLLPGDIYDDCEDAVLRTIADKAAKDPAGEWKRLADAFLIVNVGVEDLRAYLGHPLDKVTAAEVIDLRKVYAAIKTGEARWAEVIEARQAETGAEAAAKAPPSAPAKDLGEVTRRAREKREAAKAPKDVTPVTPVAEEAAVPAPPLAAAAGPTGQEPPKGEAAQVELVDETKPKEQAKAPAGQAQGALDKLLGI